jgi:hypothetical protein
MPNIIDNTCASTPVALGARLRELAQVGRHVHWAPLRYRVCPLLSLYSLRAYTSAVYGEVCVVLLVE